MDWEILAGVPMTDHSVTLSVPEDLYNQARELAEATDQPLENVFLQRLEASFSTPLSRLPLDEQAELAALKFLSDDALWTMAREQMPQARQDRMESLMRLNSMGQIDGEGYKELSKLVEQGQRLMLRKAQASDLLMDRGYKITSKDLQPKDA